MINLSQYEADCKPNFIKIPAELVGIIVSGFAKLYPTYN